MDANHVTIDGVSVPVESPASAEALATRVQECANSGTAVFPVGGGIGLDYGRPPARQGIALSVTKLNRVVDYPIEDLTITVEAGMTVATLFEWLAKNNQRLPIDVPRPETATVGGAIAVNASGPRRLGYGTWRDWIIGMTVVNDRGELCKSGGRVVKNVAGYDLGKLYTGSLGSLGIIAQVTLKLQPRPETQKWVGIDDIPPTNLTTVLNQLHVSATMPRAVEVQSTDRRFSLGVLFEDNQESVNWQIEQLRRELTPHVVVQRPAEFDRQLAERHTIATSSLQLVATMRSSQVAEFLKSNAAGDSSIHAHAMNGVVWIGSGVNHLADAKASHKQITERVDSFGGNVVVRRCPLEWKSELPIWGRPPASLGLMKIIKHEFDPKNILNPGRTLV